MKALVTGSHGFIGSHFVEMASSKYDLTYSFADTDIDLIFSIASGAEASESISRPRHFIRNNTDLIVDLLEVARANPGLKHFIHLSTSEVYGPCDHGDDKREWSPIVTHSPYAASKACQEAICMAYWKCFGIPVTIVNTMNVFGERQQRHKFIPTAVRKILKGEEVVIHGSEHDETRRRYIHADVVSDAMLFLASQEYPHKYVSANRPPRFNVVGEREISLLDLVGEIAAILNRPFRHRLETPSRPGHGGRYSLDGSKMKERGWNPHMSFDESLRQTVASLIPPLSR